MRILFIVTYLYPRGGDSNHAFSVAEGLRKRGHEVIFFGMEDEKNLPDQPEPLAPGIDYKELLRSTSPLKSLQALKSIYSFSSKRAARDFITRHGPFDIAHVHSVHHQLTLSVLDVLKNRRIPFIWTLHDYKLVCPNTTLFIESSCERCSNPGKGSPLCIVWHRCKKDSLSASLLTAIESCFNYIGGYYNYPECYIAPCSFLGKLIEQSKVTSRPIHIIPNYSPILPEEDPEPLGNDIVCIGRLVRGKGVDVLVKAYSRVHEEIAGNLIIVGTGDAEEDLKKLTEEILPDDRYFFTGQIDSSEEIAQYYRSARCVILPSVWYENMPLSILEAFSFARPVIASDIGGIPELVKNNETGLLFEPGSVEELADRLKKLNDNMEAAQLMGLNGWHKVKTVFSREKYMDRILGVYSSILCERSGEAFL